MFDSSIFVFQAIEREIERLARMHSMSTEHAFVVRYLDWMTLMPWGEITRERYDVAEARSILEEDHFGLEEVKASPAATTPASTKRWVLAKACGDTIHCCFAWPFHIFVVTQDSGPSFQYLPSTSFLYFGFKTSAPCRFEHTGFLLLRLLLFFVV